MLMELLFLIVLFLFILSAYAFVSLAPWVPTRSKDFERINELAKLKKGGIFYEIGCGTAAVSSYIAKNNPEAQVIGIELALPIFAYAKVKSLIKGPKNLHICFGDALDRNYADADAVYIFGLPETVNGNLKDKLERELKLGARFISYVFEVKDWKGSRSFCNKPTSKDASIYVYEE